eukprot:6241669-Prymnesium_polylepis.1
MGFRPCPFWPCAVAAPLRGRGSHAHGYMVWHFPQCTDTWFLRERFSWLRTLPDASVVSETFEAEATARVTSWNRARFFESS